MGNFDYINSNKNLVMRKMLDENQLVSILDNILISELRFQTYHELQITNKNIDIGKILKNDQKRIRIDLCGISKIDMSIHFFEAERQLHIQHPTIYRHFCDYCYLVCPEEQFNLLDSGTQKEQLAWAKQDGIGIITISKEGKLRLRMNARKQELSPDIREEIIHIMQKRYRIRDSLNRDPNKPLWSKIDPYYRNKHS
jgi:hypothetical protein